MSATARISRGMTRRPFDTNESRRRHARNTRFGYGPRPDGKRQVLGYIYTCPRCGLVATPMYHRVGAERLADEHALVCPGSRATVTAG